MKFELYIDSVGNRSVEFCDVLEENPIIAKKLCPYIRRVDRVSLEKDMDIMQCLIELGSKHNVGYDIEIITKFTKKELDSFELYTILGTKFITQDDTSINKMLDYSRELEQVSASKPYGYRRHNYKEYFLKKPKILKPESFAVCSGSGSQFFFGDYIANLMEQSGLTGWTKFPVVHPVTNVQHKDIYMLGINHELPRIIKDNKFLGSFESGFDLQSLVMLEQSDLDSHGLEDFNFTQENLAGDRSGLCCITKKVYDFYHYHKLKGLKFRPVLIKGTAPYEEYVEKWTCLEQLFSGVPELSIHERW